jgi:uncharacterized phosphosugar-binding protein
MNALNQYYLKITRLLQMIHDNEQESIKIAATAMADQIKKGNIIHVLGTGGHSMMGAEELMWRAGGLVPIDPIFDPGLSIQQGAIRSNLIERLPGYMLAVLRNYRLAPGELIIIVNAYGVNAATIDTALESKRLGLTVIGVTGKSTAELLSLEHPSRHPSGKNLHEIVDIFINTYVPAGDAVVVIPGIQQKVSAVSTIANAFALESMVAKTVEILVAWNIQPPVWVSANLPGGEEENRKHQEEYQGKIRFL